MKKIVFLLLCIVFGIQGLCDAAMVLYYNFDEVSGSLAADTAGAGDPAFDGTLSDGFTFDDQSVTGKFGGALNMAGDVDIDINYDGGIILPGETSAGNNFTVSLWFKNANASEGGVIFAYGRSGLRFTIGIGSLNGVPEVRVYSKALNDTNPDVLIRKQLPLSGIDIEDGQWHHLAVAVSSTQGNTAADPLIYVDGLCAGGTATANAWTTDLGVFLGRRVFSSKVYYDGYIDDFAIFNTTLSSQDITDIYTSALPIPEPATIALLGFACFIFNRKKV